MRRFAFSSLVLVLVSTASLSLLTSVSHGFQDPFAEGVRPTDPLTPDQEQKSFELPEGFQIELVAAEPEIQKPLNIAFDTRGRLWLTCTIEYPYAAPLDKPGRDSIRILEDKDGDGRAETVTTFAEGLNIPIGIYPYKNGCIAYSIPYISYYEDLDGDWKCDKVTKLYGPMGFERDTHGMNNAFRRGFDGWLYACHGFNNETKVAGADGHQIHMQSGNTYRMRTDGARVEQFTWGQVNPFGMSLDPWGNFFTADCHTKPIYQLVRGGYYPSFGKPHDGLGFIPPMMDHLHGSTAIAGVSYYAAPNFPAEYQGNMFSGNVMTSRINRNHLERHGATIKCIEEPDFVKTSDPWFRPVDIVLGPDGALYVADFYNRIIGHYEVPLTHPGRDRDRGRLWKISYGSARERTSTSNNFAAMTTEQLVEELANPNFARRMLAVDQIVDNSSAENLKSGVELLRNAIQSGKSATQTVHAAWILERLGNLDHDSLSGLAKSESAEVRTHFYRILSERSVLTGEQSSQLAKGLSDEVPEVCFAAADANAQHPSRENIPALLNKLAATDAQDVLLRQAIRIALKAAFRELGSELQLDSYAKSPLNSQAIAEICLAVPNEQAATYLVRHVSNNGVEDPIVLAEMVRHASRFAPAVELEKLRTVVTEKFGENLEFQIDVFGAILKGLGERGISATAETGSPNAIPPGIRNWGDALAKRLLESVGSQKQAWSNSIIEGKKRTENPWVVEKRQSSDGDKTSLFFSTLPTGEQATGRLRSSPFAAPKSLNFFLAGHNGFPDKEQSGTTYARLRDATTNEVLQQSAPPRNDIAQRIEWDLSAHEGKQVVFEVEEGDEGGAYAWISVGRFDPPVLTVSPFSPQQLAQRAIAGAAICDAIGLSELTSQLRLALAGTGDAAAQQALVNSLGRFEKRSLLRSISPILGIADIGEVWKQELVKLSLDPQYDEEKSKKLLSDVLKSLPSRLQLQVVSQLASDAESGKLILGLFEQGVASRTLLQNQQLLAKLEALKIAGFKETVAKLTENLPPANQQLDALIEGRKLAYDKSAKNVTRGAMLFEKHCAICHQVAGKGATVGPQLDGLGNRGLNRILEDMLDPNRNVDVAFRLTLIETNDGNVVAGLIRSNEGEQVKVIDNQGKEHSIPKSDIASEQPSPLSLMPENLVSDLPVEDMADLVAYLMQLREKK